MIIDSSRKAFEVLHKNINDQQEEVWVLTLDADLRLIEKEMLFRGTVNECTLHPRDIIRTLCARNASAFILAHNHPSGRTQPSREDKQVTQRIQKIANLLEIPLKDHLVLTKDNYYSFADKGQLVSR